MSRPIIPSGKEFDEGLGAGPRQQGRVKRTLKRLAITKRTDRRRVHDLKLSIQDGAGEMRTHHAASKPAAPTPSRADPSLAGVDAPIAQPSSEVGAAHPTRRATVRAASPEKLKKEKAKASTGNATGRKPAQRSPVTGESSSRAESTNDESEDGLENAPRDQDILERLNESHRDDLLVALAGRGSLECPSVRLRLDEAGTILISEQTKDLLDFLLTVSMPLAPRKWESSQVPADVRAVLYYVVGLPGDPLATYRWSAEQDRIADAPLRDLRSYAVSYPVLETVASMIERGTTRVAVMQRVGGYDSAVFRTHGALIIAALVDDRAMSHQGTVVPLLPLHLELDAEGFELDLALTILSRVGDSPTLTRPLYAALKRLGAALTDDEAGVEALRVVGIEFAKPRATTRRRRVIKAEPAETAPTPSRRIPDDKPISCKRCGWRPAERWGFCEGCRDYGD